MAPDTQHAGMPDGAAMSAHALAKTFHSAGGPVQALKGVSFEVPRESVFAILGPNGAGKTTLLRILTTMMRPGSGTAWIEGYEIGRQNIQVRRCIGIVAQDNHFDKYLSAWQNLMLHARLHGMEKTESEARITELLQSVDLYERRHDFLEDFSGGMQRRVSLIRALIHRPKVLFLDEPTTGLDPAARIEIWDTIQKLKRSATTIILTTHYMEEADRLSDQVMILNQGRVVMTGTPGELKARISPPDTYELQLNGPVAADYLERLTPPARDVTLVNPTTLRFTLVRPEHLADLVARVAPGELKQVGLAQADMETVYLTVAADIQARRQEGALP